MRPHSVRCAVGEAPVVTLELWRAIPVFGHADFIAIVYLLHLGRIFNDIPVGIDEIGEDVVSAYP